MSRAWMWTKMAIAGVVMCVGGPALVIYVTPSEEELFKKFNPDLQRRNLEKRPERQRQHEEFVAKLKEYSRSDKPIWVVAAEEEEKAKQAAAEEQARLIDEAQRLKEEIRRHSTGAK